MKQKKDRGIPSLAIMINSMKESMMEKSVMVTTKNTLLEV